MKNVFIVPVIFLFSACSNPASDEKTQAADSTQTNPVSHEEMEMQEMKEMAEKQKQTPQENPYKDAKIEVKATDNTKAKNADDTRVGGFGYDIYIFDALYVHQPNVPAINGNRGFKTKAQAQKAGEFVAYKIRNNIMPPSVSIKELDSLGVLK